MAHDHPIIDVDKHFTIDPTTRKLSPEKPDKANLVQFDHNSERLTFELPRYIDGHDMLTCNEVWVHFNNIEVSTKRTNPGVYQVTDLQASEEHEDVLVCSWLVSQEATQLVGLLSFVVSFVCAPADGVVEYRWNSAPYTGISVLNGIFNSDIVVKEYADVLVEWEERIRALEEGGSGGGSTLPDADTNHWKGKKWYAYGTSLTSEAQGTFASYVSGFGGMLLTNKGIPGGGIVTNTNIKNAVMNTVDGKTEADLITLEVGANDTTARLGTVYDEGNDTFCGALNQCIRYLQQNTDAQIVVMSSTNSNIREPGYEYTEPSGGKSIVNAFDPDDPDILTGQYIKNGVLTASTTFNESGFIPIGGSRMYIYFPTTNLFYTSLNACFYDENKEYIGYQELLDTDYYPIPEGAVYVRVPFKPTNLRVQMVFFADEGDVITLPETPYTYAGHGETIFTLGGAEEKSHTKLDQWKAIREVCMVNSVPYIPLGEEGGLGYARLTGKYLVDKIHHTDLGGYNLAQFIWSRLKNIPLWYGQK